MCPNVRPGAVRPAGRQEQHTEAKYEGKQAQPVLTFIVWIFAKPLTNNLYWVDAAGIG